MRVVHAIRLSIALTLAALLLVANRLPAKDSDPNLMAFSNASGQLRTFNTKGAIDLNNPFFQDLGTNGRRCVTCHDPGDAWTVTPQSIQARFPAQIAVFVFHFHAVHAQASHPPGPIRVAGDDHAGVAIGTQDLARVKAKATDGAQRAGPFPLVFGTEGLGRVFDDRHLVTLGNLPQSFHVRALAEQMHRHDGASAGEDGDRAADEQKGRSSQAA